MGSPHSRSVSPGHLLVASKPILDPRPETEGIIEESTKIIKNKHSSIKILDIGTGSGAIAISLAREFINANIMTIDNSEEVRQMYKEYVTALSSNNKEKEMVQEEISEEDL